MEERILSCEIVKDLIPSYVDELLSEDVKVAVDEHLKGCVTCQNALAEYKRKQDEETKINLEKEEKFVRSAKSAKYYLTGILIGAVIPFLALVVFFIIRVIITKAQGY